MGISRDDINKLAFLSRLEINDVENKKYQKQLSSVLGYIDELKKVDCEDLEVLGLQVDNFNQLRDDVVEEWGKDEVDKAIKQANELEDNQYKVKRVL
jgi:aspartyl-tRNA(Asn)/glutamyl-tRNA(Gln) amidotransferase subunit C